MVERTQERPAASMSSKPLQGPRYVDASSQRLLQMSQALISSDYSAKLSEVDSVGFAGLYSEDASPPAYSDAGHF